MDNRGCGDDVSARQDGDGDAVQPFGGTEDRQGGGGRRMDAKALIGCAAIAVSVASIIVGYRLSPNSGIEATLLSTLIFLPAIFLFVLEVRNDGLSRVIGVFGILVIIVILVVSWNYAIGTMGALLLGELPRLM